MTPSPLSNVHEDHLSLYNEDFQHDKEENIRQNRLMLNSEIEHDAEELFVVSTYTDFQKLAHGPRGTVSTLPIYTYRFNPSDGSMVLMSVTGDKREVVNPAFVRHHPSLDVVYVCTEDIECNGQIIAYSLSGNGVLTKIGQVDAGGTSTCYLTIDRAHRNLLAVNYWDSTLVVIPLSTETGEFTGPIHSVYDPKQGARMVAAAKKDGGCNHSNNDESTIMERQKDPHSHALVLDKLVGCIAYVPDLGKDVVREFLYDKEKGAISMEINALPSGLCTSKPDGPRYICFHPTYDVAYIVNELSSTIAVFSVDRALLKEIAQAVQNKEPMEKFKGRTTLRLVQSISTIPSAFPTKMNTCGRVCVHKAGNFVIVSNRGHESIAIFRVERKNGPKRGCLKRVGFFHTRGETPRHFQFDHSGQFIIVANQDSNSIAVFSFNLSTGEIKYTGNEYRVPSPNFVCSCPMVTDYYNDEVNEYDGCVSIETSGNLLSSHYDMDVRGNLDDSVTSKNEILRAELILARKKIVELEMRMSGMSVS